jgi:DNA-binding IclR family transcriptional regulator
MPDDVRISLTAPEAAGSRQSVKSLLKMVEVLDCFSAMDRELSAVEIAQRTGIPRTTVHRIVDSLRAVGLIEQEASRERYRLGIKLFQLGSTALTNLPLYREAPPFVDTLAKLSGETVHLCVFDGMQMVFVERNVRDSGRPNNSVTVVEATPCHSTGVGKVTLAFQDPPVIERVIEAGLIRCTSRTITDPVRLRDELAAIRERGYATDDCEHEPDVRCVAAPIRNSAGRVFAGISASGPSRRLPDARLAELAPLVMTHARMLSVRLGCTA